MPVGYCFPYCVERPTCPIVVGFLVPRLTYRGVRLITRSYRGG